MTEQVTKSQWSDCPINKSLTLFFVCEAKQPLQTYTGAVHKELWHQPPPSFMTPPPTRLLLALPPCVCVWKPSWPTDSIDTFTAHGYITRLILFMILSLICIFKWYAHTYHVIRTKNMFFAFIYTIQCHNPQPQTYWQHTCRLINCSHIPLLEGDDNCGRAINYCCLHINYKHHVWQWGKWDLVTNFMRLGCPAAFLNMLQIAIPYLASVMGSYG